MILYRVKNWLDNFENNRTRQIESCTHVWVPNKQHGLGFTYILSQPDGAAILGIWYLIIEACSLQRLPRQGFLTDTGTSVGRQWNVTTMSLRWRRKPEEIQRALDVLSSQDVDWIEIIQPNVNAASVGRQSGAPSLPLIQEQKQEQKLHTLGGVTPIDSENEELYKKYPLLKTIHAVPMLRAITKEVWLTCIGRRSPHMDWPKAVKYVCDMAELQTDIKKPGPFVDTYLGIYEKDHLANIQSREQHAAQRFRDLKAYVEYVQEMGKEYPERIQEMKRDMTKQYGQNFIIEAERILNAS